MGDIRKENTNKTDEEFIFEHSHKNRVSKAFVTYPSVFVCVTLVFAFICSILMSGAIDLEGQSDRDFLVWDDLRVKRNDALTEATEKVREEDLGDQETPLQTELQGNWLLYIMYKSSTSNVMTPSNLAVMRQVEQVITSNKRYSNVCVATSSTDRTCEEPLTNLPWFSQYASPTQAEIDQVIKTKAEDDFTKNKIYFDRGFTEQSPVAKWSRAMFQFALPLQDGDKRYRSSTDDFRDQKDYYIDFLTDVEPDVMDLEPSDMDIYFFSWDWWSVSYDRMVMKDFNWVIVSFLFVLTYMMIHTWSVALPILGMVEVMSAYPVAYFVYRFIMQVQMFNSMSLLSVFIILGIAADDIFVFMDAWKQSAHYACLQADFELRFAYVYRRAAKAMFVTTITTFGAFMATSISEIAPIAAFGLYSAALILSNYCLVITFFPACVVLRHRLMEWNEKRKAKRTGKTAEGDKKEEPRETEMPMYTNVAGTQGAATEGKDDDVRVPATVSAGEVDVAPEKAGKLVPKTTEESRVEKFFAGKYMEFIIKGRFIIIGCFVVWWIVALILATNISPLTRQENFFPDDHDITIAFDAIEDTYHIGETDGIIKIKMVYGIDKLDRSDVGRFDLDDLGEVVWDEEFEMSSETNQRRLLEICESLKTNDLVLDGLVTCFIETFSEWDGISSFPVAQSEFHTKMKEFLESSEGYTFKNQKAVGYVGNDMRYAWIEVVGKGQFDPYETMMPRWEKWEDLMDAINANSPTGINRGYQSSQAWLFMITEKALYDNAFQGMAIAGAIAFVVLISSTLNIILALFAIFCISGIVISVLGLVYILGWEFGMVVSVAMVILIGFSVDYAVHMCHAYVESKEEEREARTRDALKKMGISILGGATTTFGAGVVLFATVLVFFQRFAWIISSTIVFSLLWALLFLPALCVVIGPQGTVGNLKHYAKILKTKYDESKKNKQKK